MTIDLTNYEINQEIKQRMKKVKSAFLEEIFDFTHTHKSVFPKTI